MGFRASSALALLLLVSPGCVRDGDERGVYEKRTPALHGDVDGETDADPVYVAIHNENPCSFLLVAEGSAGVSTPFSVACAKPSELEAAPPYVAGLFDLDREPGLEILIKVDHGASRVDYVVYTVRPGGILAEVAADEQDFFETGGSVGTGSRYVDGCRPRGTFVTTSIDHHSRRAQRASWRIDGVDVHLITRREIRLPASGRTPFPETRGEQPFPSCLGVRSAR